MSGDEEREDPAVEARRLVADTIAAMEVHQGAHAMWGAEVGQPDGTTDCPTCGLTWMRMYRAVARGGYHCAYAAHAALEIVG